MNKEFVTYDIAVKLKELGFNEPCLAYFNADPALKTPAFNMVKPFEHDWCLPAPLWQQAISFLKEKKVLVAETWDGWEYGAYEWDNFIYCKTKEQVILKAIELCKKN